MVQKFRYETSAMAKLRELATADHAHTDEDMDTFVSILTTLERKGFTLSGPS